MQSLNYSEPGNIINAIYVRMMNIKFFLIEANNLNLIFLIWLFLSLAVIFSIFNVIKKYEIFSSYIISIAPAIIVGFCIYEGILKDLSFVNLTIFACFFLLSLKYGWRISRIVAWQRFTGEFKNYNFKKEKV